MRLFDTSQMAGPDWTGPTVTGIGDVAVKLRWIDSAFRWHRNTGAELFMVIDGEVDMHVRKGSDGPVDIVRMESGKALLIEDGEEHVAHPVRPSRILVVEQADSE